MAAMPDPASPIAPKPRHPGSPAEVFAAFLKMGCSAFGGPIAHIGFFRHEFVEKRRWLDDASFADLVALCQFLPGPASSQTAIALGWRRAGYGGALLAWIGFTGPSAVLMIAAAFGAAAVGDLAHAGWIQGLKVAAVAVVAQALMIMARTLCPEARTATLAIAAAIALLVFPPAWMQLVVLGGGALAGWWWLSPHAVAPVAAGPAPHRWAGAGWLAGFFVLLVALPAAAQIYPAAWLQITDGFYRAGSLVFGGGHTVLPLLEKTTVARGWLDHDTFLAGYGAAQALPGPLFAFAAYLGAVQSVAPNGIAGGLLALGAIYLPSAFLIFGALPQWERLRRAPTARAMMAGTNAAVVGLLGAAFYQPIWTSAITGVDRVAVALAAFAALAFWKLPPWLVVLGAAGAGAAFL